MEHQLLSLVEKWETSARFAFLSAEKQEDEFGKRFVEHGAMCYTNCATDLKEALSSCVLQPLTTQEEGQK